MAEQTLVAEGFGQRVRALRETKGMTQTELAEAVGKALSAVSDWETEKRLPRDTDILIRLAAVLGTSIDYLLLNVEGEREFFRRRLRELLEELDQLERAGMHTAAAVVRRRIDEERTGETALADADIVHDTRAGRRKRRGA